MSILSHATPLVHTAHSYTPRPYTIRRRPRPWHTLAGALLLGACGSIATIALAQDAPLPPPPAQVAAPAPLVDRVLVDGTRIIVVAHPAGTLRVTCVHGAFVFGSPAECRTLAESVVQVVDLDTPAPRPARTRTREEGY
jgi:hypothetical protein